MKKVLAAHPGGGGGGVGGVAPVGVAVPGEEEGGRDQAWAQLSSVQHSDQSQLITEKLWRHHAGIRRDGHLLLEVEM